MASMRLAHPTFFTCFSLCFYFALRFFSSSFFLVIGAAISDRCGVSII